MPFFFNIVNFVAIIIDMENGLNWNKSGTNPVENKIIADNAFKAIEDIYDPYKIILDEEDKSYIDRKYPKTNDDSRNEEVSQLRVIEGPDVYQKLDYTTEDQIDLQNALIRKNQKDYSDYVHETWNSKGDIEDHPEEDLDMLEANLKNLTMELEGSSRFDLKKGGSLTQADRNKISWIQHGLNRKIQAMKSDNPALTRLQQLHDQSERIREKYMGKYAPWSTDPNLN